MTFTAEQVLAAIEAAHRKNLEANGYEEESGDGFDNWYEGGFHTSIPNPQYDAAARDAYYAEDEEIRAARRANGFRRFIEPARTVEHNHATMSKTTTEQGMTLLIDGGEYKVEVVDTTGGEDEGSNATCTIKVGDGYYRKSGYYASHHGYDWDGDFVQVHPKTKTVTVYE